MDEEASSPNDQSLDLDPPELFEQQPNPPQSKNRLDRTHYILLWISFWPTLVALTVLLWVVVAKSNMDLSAIAVIDVAITYLMGSGGLRLWRFLKRGKFRSGVVVGALGWFYGPVYGVALLVLSALGAVQCSDIDGKGILQNVIESQQAIEARRHIASGVARELEKTAGSQLFSNCVETLYREHGADTMINSTIRAMKTVSVTTAQQLTYDAIVNVCLAHMKSPKLDLGPYLGRTIRNLRLADLKERSKFDVCSVDLTGLGRESTRKKTYEILDVNRAICQLSESEQVIIKYAAEGYTAKEVGARLEISDSTARKRKERVLVKLRGILGR